MPDHDRFEPLDDRLRGALGSVEGDWTPTPARRVRVLSAVHHRLRRRQFVVTAVVVALVALPLVGTAVVLGTRPGSNTTASADHAVGRTAVPGAGSASAASPAAPGAHAPIAPDLSLCGSGAPASARVVVGSGPARCAGSVQVLNPGGVAAFASSGAGQPTATVPPGVQGASQNPTSNSAPTPDATPGATPGATLGAPPSSTATPATITVRVGERLTVTLPGTGSSRLAWTAPAVVQTGATTLGTVAQSNAASGAATGFVFVARRAPGSTVIGATELAARCPTGAAVCGGALASYQVTVEVRG